MSRLYDSKLASYLNETSASRERETNQERESGHWTHSERIAYPQPVWEFPWRRKDLGAVVASQDVVRIFLKRRAEEEGPMTEGMSQIETEILEPCDRCSRIVETKLFGCFHLCGACLEIAVEALGLDAAGRAIERLSALHQRESQIREALQSVLDVIDRVQAVVEETDL
jgi:hypothetical protein